MLALPLVLLSLAAGPDDPPAPAPTQAPPGRFSVVTPKDNGIIGIDINDRGDVLGFEWVEEKETPGVISQVPFVAKEGKAAAMTTIPVLKGYTSAFPAAISDDGVVAGHVGKPPARPGVRTVMRTQAFVWDEASGARGLGVLPDDWSSVATAISRDGTTIAGYSVGENRRRACVWDRTPGGDAWVGSPLPQSEAQLHSNTVALSPDGHYATAVEGLVPCLWTREPDRSWTREAIGDRNSLVPRAVNNAGQVVGIRFKNDGNTEAVLWTREKGCQDLPRPAGYVSAEATALNARGDVVGFVDGPHGSIIGPHGFVYADGQLRIITEGGPFFSSATGINDNGQIIGVVQKEDEEPEAPKAVPAKP